MVGRCERRREGDARRLAVFTRFGFVEQARAFFHIQRKGAPHTTGGRPGMELDVSRGAAASLVVRFPRLLGVERQVPGVYVPGDGFEGWFGRRGRIGAD